jgi:hypothetical protein
MKFVDLPDEPVGQLLPAEDTAAVLIYVDLARDRAGTRDQADVCRVRFHRRHVDPLHSPLRLLRLHAAADEFPGKRLTARCDLQDLRVKHPVQVVFKCDHRSGEAERDQ